MMSQAGGCDSMDCVLLDTTLTVDWRLDVNNDSSSFTLPPKVRIQALAIATASNDDDEKKKKKNDNLSASPLM